MKTNKYFQLIGLKILIISNNLMLTQKVNVSFNDI